jgi:hypothetical protein
LAAKFGILVKRSGISMAHKALLVNGPNPKMLGRGEPEVHGSMLLAKLERRTERHERFGRIAGARVPGKNEAPLYVRRQVTSQAELDSFFIYSDCPSPAGVALGKAQSVRSASRAAVIKPKLHHVPKVL